MQGSHRKKRGAQRQSLGDLGAWGSSAETRKTHLPGAGGAMLGAHMRPEIVMLLPDREGNLVIHEDEVWSSKKTC